jgi:hypothetical protein
MITIDPGCVVVSILTIIVISKAMLARHRDSHGYAHTHTSFIAPTKELSSDSKASSQPFTVSLHSYLRPWRGLRMISDSLFVFCNNRFGHTYIQICLSEIVETHTYVHAHMQMNTCTERQFFQSPLCDHSRLFMCACSVNTG